MKIERNGHIEGTNFCLQEFIPRTVYDQYVNNSIWFLDPRLIPCMQHIRDFFSAPVIINTWHKEGRQRKMRYRGFRSPHSTLGADLSQHKMGRACDFNVQGVSPEDVALSIIVNEDEFLEYGLTALENPAHTPTWTHIDLRYTCSNELLIVNP